MKVWVLFFGADGESWYDSGVAGVYGTLEEARAARDAFIGSDDEDEYYIEEQKRGEVPCASVMGYFKILEKTLGETDPSGGRGLRGEVNQDQ